MAPWENTCGHGNYRTTSLRELVADLKAAFTPPPIGERAEYCDERVCLSLSACLSVRDHIFGTTRPIFTNFVYMMAVARSSSGGVVIRYVLPVLWMTSYVHTS